MLSDQRGDVNLHILRKLHSLSQGVDEETKILSRRLRQEIDTDSQRLRDKLDIVKNKFTEFYLATHANRRQDMIKKQQRVI